MMKNSANALLLGGVFCIIFFIVFFLVQTCKLSPIDHTTEYKSIILNLNSATEEELDEIPGIGTALARNIVAYREKYGAYVDTDELLNIKGMSQEQFEKITQYICVGGS